MPINEAGCCSGNGVVIRLRFQDKKDDDDQVTDTKRSFTETERSYDWIGNIFGFVVGASSVIYSASADKHWAIPHTNSVIKALDSSMIFGLSVLSARELVIGCHDVIKCVARPIKYCRGGYGDEIVVLPTRVIADRVGAVFGVIAGVILVGTMWYDHDVSLLGLGDPLKKDDTVIKMWSCFATIGVCVAIARAAVIGLHDAPLRLCAYFCCKIEDGPLRPISRSNSLMAIDRNASPTRAIFI